MPKSSNSQRVLYGSGLFKRQRTEEEEMIKPKSFSLKFEKGNFAESNGKDVEEMTENELLQEKKRLEGLVALRKKHIEELTKNLEEYRVTILWKEMMIELF